MKPVRRCSIASSVSRSVTARIGLAAAVVLSLLGVFFFQRSTVPELGDRIRLSHNNTRLELVRLGSDSSRRQLLRDAQDWLRKQPLERQESAQAVVRAGLNRILADAGQFTPSAYTADFAQSRQFFHHAVSNHEDAALNRALDFLGEFDTPPTTESNSIRFLAIADSPNTGWLRNPLDRIHSVSSTEVARIVRDEIHSLRSASRLHFALALLLAAVSGFCCDTTGAVVLAGDQLRLWRAYLEKLRARLVALPVNISPVFSFRSNGFSVELSSDSLACFETVRLLF